MADTRTAASDAMPTVASEEKPSESARPPLPTTESEACTMIGPRKAAKKPAVMDDDEPLVDTTEALPLKSKKTRRMQERQQKKLKKTTVTSETKSFLELPPELLQEVLGYLQPSDIFRLLRLNKATREFVLDNVNLIAKDIIDHRYHTLARSFHLPVPLADVDRSTQALLLSKNWQDKLTIHKKPYQHVRVIDPTKVCTCMSCLLSWNNLNVILDLAFFQRHLNKREPIPMIPRGTYPEWNRKLVERNASIVDKAMQSPLHYAAILQIHLNTIVGTLTRQVRVGKKTCHPRRLFHLSTSDIESGTDRFLERSGPPSYEFPFHRDNYYSLEAYVPNRKWGRDEQAWMYAKPGQPHENDLFWVIARFTHDAEKDMDQFVSDFSHHLRA